jgi:hypothetical protein
MPLLEPRRIESQIHLDGLRAGFALAEHVKEIGQIVMLLVADEIGVATDFTQSLRAIHGILKIANLIDET